MMKKHCVIVCIISAVFLMLSGCSEPAENPGGITVTESRPKVAVCWNNVRSYSYESALAAVNELDVDVIELQMVRSYDLQYDAEGNLKDAKDENNMLNAQAAKLVKMNTWQNSDAEKVLADVDAVIFPGGSDISPTLFYTEQPCHGIPEEIDYCAERDVSDYILMSYCLDHDIPVLGLCRGMQMLSVVSGADMIQDIGTWYSAQGIRYTDMHRDPGKKVLVPHKIDTKSEDSLLWKIIGRSTLEGCPSYHHQSVGSVAGTRLTVTAEVETDGLPVIEAVERRDKTFCLGIQFHPEIAVRKHLDHEADENSFMDYDTAMLFFKALINSKAGTGTLDEAA